MDLNISGKLIQKMHFTAEGAEEYKEFQTDTGNTQFTCMVKQEIY